MPSQAAMDVADGAADGEGGEELVAGHVERSGGEDEGAERHGRRQDGGQGYGEDGVVLHPFADAFEDAWGDTLFEEGHAAGVSYLMAEVSAEGGADGGEEDEEEHVPCWAARTMIMMSVMPGMGSGTKEQSTMETRKTPKTPKLRTKCRKGLRVRR